MTGRGLEVIEGYDDIISDIILFTWVTDRWVVGGAWVTMNSSSSWMVDRQVGMVAMTRSGDVTTPPD